MGIRDGFATTETRVAIVRTRGSGRALGIVGGHTWMLVSSEETGGAYAIIEQEIPPGGGPPRHVHRHESEIFQIMEGEFELTVGDETFRATAGTVAVCPRDLPHVFRNVGEAIGRLTITIIPGRFGEYFLEADGVPSSDGEALRRMTAKYGVEILEAPPEG
jgi:quercetin dioxygenase-like cupin family protein